MTPKSHASLESTYLSRISFVAANVVLISAGSSPISSIVFGASISVRILSIRALEGTSSSITFKISSHLFIITSSLAAWSSGSYLRSFFSKAIIASALFPKNSCRRLFHASPSNAFTKASAFSLSGVITLICSYNLEAINVPIAHWIPCKSIFVPNSNARMSQTCEK